MQRPSQASVFEALSDATRREILGQLRRRGPLSLGEIAGELPMTRQAATKHLDRLSEAGLVQVRWEGRQRMHELEARPLKEVDDWLAPYSAFWDDALAHLERHLEENP